MNITVEKCNKEVIDLSRFNHGFAVAIVNGRNKVTAFSVDTDVKVERFDEDFNPHIAARLENIIDLIDSNPDRLNNRLFILPEEIAYHMHYHYITSAASVIVNL